MENSDRLEDNYLLPYNAAHKSKDIHVYESIESLYDTRYIIAIEMRLQELSLLYNKKIVIHLTCNDITYKALKMLWLSSNFQIEREEV